VTRLSLSVQCARPFDGLPARSTLRRWVQLAFDGRRVAAAELSLRFIDTREGRRLNRTYRRRDHATNVLTFDYARGRRVVADIVLCVPVVRAEAKLQHKSFRAHLAHLVLHGVLHAQGFDHQRADDAKRMEKREIALLARLGIEDPYA
jgi:probable rRNA maturation factor